MSYIESNLRPGERVLFVTRLHWSAFINPAVILLFAVYDPGGLFLIAGTLLAMFVALRYRSTEIGVTDQRLVGRTGVIIRQTLDTPLPEVATLSVSEGLLGRPLGSGSVTIRDTGGRMNHFMGIARPLALRDAVSDQRAALGLPPLPARGATSP